MKIKFIKSTACIKMGYSQGEQAEVSTELGWKLIKNGFAIAIGQPPTEPIPDTPQKPNPALPTVGILYDVKGWAFYNKAMNLKKYLSEFYNIHVLQNETLDTIHQLDVLLSFSPACTPAHLKKAPNLITGYSSHESAKRKEATGQKYIFTNDHVVFKKFKNTNKFYVPNGVDTTFFAHPVRQHPGKTATFRIGAVGSKNRQEHKGFYRLQNIIAELKKQGFKVINAGLFPDPRKTIKTREEMRHYYSQVDIFIVSSWEECTPNPLLEAMAMALPCVSNNTGMAPLLIENGKSGFMVDHYDNIEAYVNAIKKLIRYKTHYTGISKNSLASILRYDWSKMALNYKTMIDLFLAGEHYTKTRANLMINNTTIVIKTHDRPDALRACLKSIHKQYPTMPVIVVNDGSEPIKSNCKSVKIHNTRYDIGLSAGRNLAVKQVKTKYFVLCDDDFIFSDQTRLETFYRILQHSDLDIIGGNVSSSGIKSAVFSEFISPLSGKAILQYKPGSHSYNENLKYHVVDFIRNFFMARTATFVEKDIKWDERLKMGEHTLFYYTLWKNKLAKVGHTEQVFIENTRTKANPKYNAMRQRSQQFTDNNLHHYNLEMIIYKNKVRHPITPVNEMSG